MAFFSFMILGIAVAASSVGLEYAYGYGYGYYKRSAGRRNSRHRLYQFAKRAALARHSGLH